MRVPDLFRTETANEASRLFELATFELVAARRYRDAVTLSRRARQHARKHKRRITTFAWEFDALLALDPKRAWRFTQLWHRLAFKRALSIRHPHRRELEFLKSYAVPPLYLMGRFADAASILEAYLEASMRNAKRNPSIAFELLFTIYNDDAEPTHHARITLTHLYRRLNRALSNWRHFADYLRALHPRLFELVGLTIDQVIDEPGAFEAFHGHLMKIRKDRTTSGITFGERDLVEKPEGVARRQAAKKKERRTRNRASKRAASADRRKAEALLRSSRTRLTLTANERPRGVDASLSKSTLVSVSCDPGE